MSGELRVETRPHEAYVECLDGGYAGYQARCWDCDWRGAEFLRGNEPMDTPESRAHKENARREAHEHEADARIECCSRCKRALNDPDLSPVLAQSQETTRSGT